MLARGEVVNRAALMRMEATSTNRVAQVLRLLDLSSDFRAALRELPEYPATAGNRTRASSSDRDDADREGTLCGVEATILIMPFMCARRRACLMSSKMGNSRNIALYWVATRWRLQWNVAVTRYCSSTKVADVRARIKMNG